jgi:hypothetical protein
LPPFVPPRAVARIDCQQINGGQAQDPIVTSVQQIRTR